MTASKETKNKELSVELSVKDFILMLWKAFYSLTDSVKTNPEIAAYDFEKLLLLGRQKGWLEDEDERFAGNPINRRSAARILHQFMKLELKIPDSIDITAANQLKDLYTCRVCANHIAQVFVKGIMEAEEVERDGAVYKVFNHLEGVTKENGEKMIEKIRLCNQ